jgi:hypothetical protein
MGYGNNTLFENWTCPAICITGATPVLLQQSLMHSDPAMAGRGFRKRSFIPLYIRILMKNSLTSQLISKKVEPDSIKKFKNHL